MWATEASKAGTTVRRLICCGVWERVAPTSGVELIRGRLGTRGLCFLSVARESVARLQR